VVCEPITPTLFAGHQLMNSLKYDDRKSLGAQEPDSNGEARAPGTTPKELTPALGPTLLRVAWLAILLGLAMELLLVLASSLGGALGGLGPLVADLVRNVSWSVFVCVGLAVGTAVVEARVPAIGFMGLLSAPVAFKISRVLHKGTLQALAVSAGGVGDLSPFLVVVIKGLEYGCLGLGVGWVSQRRWGGALAHLGVGLLVGLGFGGSEIAYAMGGTFQLSSADFLSEAVDEILFPVGCSMVLFAATALGKRAASRGEA
jgi:hypothetical protein